MTSRSQLPISVAIPTYQRECVLTETIQQLLDLEPAAAEILVIDQTPHHEKATEDALRRWVALKRVRRLSLHRPSITHAMNVGLQEAATSVLLFVDDDIVPSQRLLAAHLAAHREESVWAVAGQVIQPWQRPEDAPATCPRAGFCADLDFPFYSIKPDFVQNVMAGNLSVKREHAIRIGGFDENFCGVSYRFETDFARRLIAHGGQIRFAPEASIRHLRAERGGTRSAGSHLTSANPAHGVGDYYFAMLQGRNYETWRYMAWRMTREVTTRFHLRHPWWIPVKLFGEIRAFLWARRLAQRGPRHLSVASCGRDGMHTNEHE